MKFFKTLALVLLLLCGFIHNAYAGGPDSVSSKHQWHYQIGFRRWNSNGHTNWNVMGATFLPAFGNPLASFSYDNFYSDTNELFFKIENPGGQFVKGYFGLGNIDEGVILSAVFLPGQVQAVDTTSEQRDGNLRYYSIDAGQTLFNNIGKRPWGIRVDMFLGYHYWNENTGFFGAMCGPAGLVPFICGAPGTLLWPFSMSLLNNNMRWSSLRFGVLTDIKLFSRVIVSADVAYIPFTSIHNQTSDAALPATLPNSEYRGDGNGWMLDIIMKCILTEWMNVGLGWRYWNLQSSGHVSLNVNAFNEARHIVNVFDSKRQGVFLQLNFILH